MSEQRPDEQDRLLDHQYDGIQEYDNPLPRWWVLVFWATIIYAGLYVANVPGIGIGRGRIAAYERDVAVARARYGGGELAAAVSESDLRAIAKQPARLADGKTTFSTNCAACHRADGGGIIGPNLTDAYWLHGGRPLEILHTVQHGVPDKGMPVWGQVLKPDQLVDVVGYVLTLRDTHPADPKAPQGTRADSTVALAR